MTLFNKTAMKNLLPKKKRGRKKRVKKVLLWKNAWKILLDGGCIRYGKRTNNDDWFVKLLDKDGRAISILHRNTYRALIRKNKIICTLYDHKQIANPDWRRKIFKVSKIKTRI